MDKFIGVGLDMVFETIPLRKGVVSRSVSYWTMVGLALRWHSGELSSQDQLNQGQCRIKKKVTWVLVWCLCKDAVTIDPVRKVVKSSSEKFWRTSFKDIER